jgi:hypothetical protein
MKKPRRTAVPPAAPPSQPLGVGTPETIARRAVARKPMIGNRVRLVITLALPRERAERLTARALREGKNLGALVPEILEAEDRRR